MRILAIPVVIGLMIGAAVSAAADPITLGGVTFSDEMDGVALVEGWGSGRLDDPIVLVEEITEKGPAILTILGLSSDFGNRIGSHHTAGFALTKIVRNRTQHAWREFTLELQEFVGYTSPYEDGLSFGQATASGRPFVSDGYVELRESNEPADRVTFSGGTVHPGESVALTIVITDMTPKPRFYLVQNRGTFVAEAPAAPPGIDPRAKMANARDVSEVREGTCIQSVAPLSCYSASW